MTKAAPTTGYVTQNCQQVFKRTSQGEPRHSTHTTLPTEGYSRPTPVTHVVRNQDLRCSKQSPVKCDSGFVTF